MKRISEYTVAVEDAVKNLHIEDMKPSPLYAPIAYAMEAGGKRLRPALVLMAAEAYGAPMQKAMPAALAMELFHNYTLLHDDVMDKSDMRRNRESVYKKYGTDAAILSGDTMQGMAEKLLLDTEDTMLRKVLGIYNRMAREVYEGQSLDMEFESRQDVTPDEYIEMIRKKTGALLGACAETGALLGGADEAQAEALREYGEMLGIAFQIEDDWLDTFGDAATFGKPIGGDINRAKKTFLLISGLSAANEESEALRMAMTLPEGDIRVKAVKRIYEKMHLDSEARKASAHYSAAAMAALKRCGLPESEVNGFKYLLDRLAGRRK